MVKQDLILSMSEPTNRTIYAKKGDSGRLYDIFIADAEKENGTLRILQPDGSEVASPAIIQAGGDAYKGDLVTFDALEEVPLTKCEVTLESSQDLHGQSSPYPSGGGKNLVDPNATIFTRYLRDAGNGSYYWTYSADSRSIAIPVSPSTAYTISRYLTNQAIYRISTIRVSTLPSVSDTTDIQSYQNIRETSASAFGTTRTITTDASATYLVIQFSGTTMLDFVQNGQVEKGSSATSYAPYSNICPIEPSNGVNHFKFQNVGRTDGGVTYTLNDDGTVSLANTATATSFLIGNVADNMCMPLEAGTYTLSGGLSNNIRLVASSYANGTSTTLATDLGQGASFTITEQKNVYVNIRVQSGQSTDVTIKPQIELGSTATSYTPYQGINVHQSGKNLAYLTYGSKVPSVSNGQMVSSNGWSSDYIPIDTTKGYVASRTLLVATYVMFYDANKGYLGYYQWSSSVNFYDLTSYANWSQVGYVKMRCDATSTADIDVQLEIGSTATSYEPYNGTTYPLSLGQNVYGGTLDLVSGKLTIDMVTETFQWGSGTASTTLTNFTRKRFNYANGQAVDGSTKDLCSVAPMKVAYSEDSCHFYSNGTYNCAFVFLPNATDNSTEIVVCHELATPIEVDLTPTQISTLLGENNIWSSGEVEVAFEYDGLLAQLPEEATEQVGKCIGDVAFTGASSMPFILHILDDVQEETP